MNYILDHLNVWAMWTVNSESGRLRSVLVHSASQSHWWKIPIPVPMRAQIDDCYVEVFNDDELLEEFLLLELLDEEEEE